MTIIRQIVGDEVRHVRVKEDGTFERVTDQEAAEQAGAAFAIGAVLSGAASQALKENPDDHSN